MAIHGGKFVGWIWWRACSSTRWAALVLIHIPWSGRVWEKALGSSWDKNHRRCPSYIKICCHWQWTATIKLHLQHEIQDGIAKNNSLTVAQRYQGQRSAAFQRDAHIYKNKVHPIPRSDVEQSMQTHWMHWQENSDKGRSTDVHRENRQTDTADANRRWIFHEYNEQFDRNEWISSMKNKGSTWQASLNVILSTNLF